MNSLCRIIGPNFSGRSHALAELLRGQGKGGESFYVGPYAESGLSGIATTVAEELAFYSSCGYTDSDIGSINAGLARPNQRVATLSGGEQTLLALQCFDSSRYAFLGIDTALEQLDPVNRSSILRYLSQLYLSGRKCCLIDNRELGGTFDDETIALKAEANAFPLNLERLISSCPSGGAPAIELRSLQFAYSPVVPVFVDVSLAMRGGCAYRLYGPNGSGKSTFLKLLAGALSAKTGELYLDGRPYNPYKGGNEIIGWAMQDPDHQWVSTSVESDLAIKIKAFEGRRYARTPKDLEITSWIACFGIATRSRQHLLDLPKALRKRLSWLWPLNGVLPWIALDEPTIGQDRYTVRRLAQALTRLIERGLGVLFVSHDDDFASLIPHETLVFANHKITAEENPRDLLPDS